MTDNEIVKALERLKNAKDYLKEQYQEQVKKCPYPELKPIAKQTYEDNKKAFDIAIKAIEEFNRLQAENERLKNHIQEGINLAKDIPEMVSLAKAEAYKEFAERLLLCYEDFDEINEVILLENLVKAIDDLLKEMEGGASEVED